MKRKLLFAIAALLCSVGSWAQIDVTSTYITNPSFETDGAKSESKDDGNVTGWKFTGYADKVVYGTSSSDIGWIKSMSATDGTYFLSIRHRWESTNQRESNLTQTITIPKGKYTLKADYKAFRNEDTNPSMMFSVNADGGALATASGTFDQKSNTNQFTGSIDRKFSIDFEAYTAENTIKFYVKAKQNIQVAIDKVQLLYNANYTSALESAIARAQLLYARTSDADLNTAITHAQGVLDGVDNTIAYQTTIDDEVTTLRSAISTAYGSVTLMSGENVTFLLENADFESGSAAIGGICTYDYDCTTNNTLASQMAAVEGWTIPANGNGRAAGVLSYGSDAFLGGSSYKPTSVTSQTSETKALGVLAVWSATAQYKQNVTLPAGRYVIEVPVYNLGGTTAFTKNLIGFIENGGTEHLATATTYTASTWTTESIEFDLNSDTEGYLSVGYQSANAGGGSMPHLLIDNVKITFTDAENAYAATVTSATATYNDAAYANVTGDEKTNLKALLDADASGYTVAQYFTAVENINAAVATFTAAKANYDQYAEAAAVATTIGATSVTAPTTAAEALTRANELNVNIDTKVTSTYTYDVTTTFAGTWAKTEMDETSGQHWSADSRKYMDAWKASGNSTATQTISLPAGEYILKVAGRGQADVTTVTMTADGQTVTFKSKGDSGKGIDKTGAANFADADETYCNSNNGRGWEWRYIPLSLASAKDVTVTLSIVRTSGSWASFSDFTILMSSTDADDDDYTALNSAISTAESHTLGFEDAQYAPYNNVDVLSKLAFAKSIDQDETNAKGVVTGATTALAAANASGWTANSGDVDAIYNHDFATATDGWNPDGWTSTGWAARVDNINSSSTISETGKGWRPNTGTITYGSTGVYTMPLAANQLYKLTFKYGAWDSWSVPTISVLNAEDGLAAKALPGTSTHYQTAMNTWTMYFETGAAGNYVLSMNATYNMVWTDVSLVKAEASEIELASGKPANNTFYQTLTLDRAFSADKWNTLCVPFEFSKSAFADVKVLDGITVTDDHVSMSFANASATIDAGTPCLVKPESDKANWELNNVTIYADAAAGTTEKTSDDITVTYQGVFTSTALNDGDNAWIVKDNLLHKVVNAGTVGAYRAYFTVEAATPVKALSFSFDDMPTAINAVEATQNENAVIYNLAGQRLSKAQKGVNIVNGKKVLVK